MKLKFKKNDLNDIVVYDNNNQIGEIKYNHKLKKYCYCPVTLTSISSGGSISSSSSIVFYTSDDLKKIENMLMEL